MLGLSVPMCKTKASEQMSSLLASWICKSLILSAAGDQPHDPRQGQREA